MRLVFSAFFLLLITHTATAQSPAARPLQTINAITFGGGYNIPAWIAQRQGLFAKHGIAVNLVYTPDSVYLMTNLIEGKFDMALTSIDNLIAYQEGQGEAPVKAPVDLAAFMGMDNAFLYLVTAPQIKTFADLRGKELSVDAMSTGFAFVLREMVNRSEIKESEITYVRAGGSPNRFRMLLEGKHAGTLLPTPFEMQAIEKGYNKLSAGMSLFGHYMGRTAFAQRAWLKQNEATAISFMRAYREAMDYLFDPRNREICEALLIANDPGMTPALAKKTYDIFVDPKSGLFRDLALDMEGVKTVLELRSKYGVPQKTLTDSMKYVDLTLHQKAFGDMKK
jgi:ABC-type nitrate/sulfonate/bicarbonate transport system substrate-binding protein